MTAVDDEGLLYIDGIGGWDPQVLVGQRIRFLTRKGQDRQPHRALGHVHHAARWIALTEDGCPWRVLDAPLSAS